MNEKFKYLHIGPANSFVDSCFLMLKDHFNINEHFFLSRSLHLDMKSDRCEFWSFQKEGWFYKFFIYTYKAKRIFLHGLFDPQVIFLLVLQPWLIRKTVWLIWGGDLYYFKFRTKSLKSNFLELFRRILIKRIPKIMTTVPGDFDLAKDWYGSNARFFLSLMYKSHTSRNVFPQKLSEKNGKIKVMVGNSGCPNNNHMDILLRLSKSVNQEFFIFAPLSYGDKDYIKSVVKLGKALFGERFFPILKLMDFESFNKFLASMDVGIFYHNRQQGMGNIIALLSLGKKVYLRSDITSWSFFKELGLLVFDSKSQLDLEPLKICEAQKNIELVKAHFSFSNLVNSWKEVCSFV